MALTTLLLLSWTAPGQAGLFGKDAQDGKERDAYTNAECAQSSTRIEAEVTLDGTKHTYHFATLYNLLAWLFTQDSNGRELTWPPLVRMRDHGAGDKLTMVELPFGDLRPDPEQGLTLVAMPGDPRQHFGPWIITTEFKLLTTDFPNALLYTDLEAAAQQAANWHGTVVHWDDEVLKLAQRYRTLSLASGGGGAPGQGATTYKVEVPEDTAPPPPMVLPGGDDEMKNH